MRQCHGFAFNISQSHTHNYQQSLPQQVFESFGPVTFIEIQKDPVSKQSRGYAFVQFKNANNAKEAMAALNGADFAGRPLKVSPVEPKSQPASRPDSESSVSVGELDDTGRVGWPCFYVYLYLCFYFKYPLQFSPQSNRCWFAIDRPVENAFDAETATRS